MSTPILKMYEVLKKATPPKGYVRLTNVLGKHDTLLFSLKGVKYKFKKGDREYYLFIKNKRYIVGDIDSGFFGSVGSIEDRTLDKMIEILEGSSGDIVIDRLIEGAKEVKDKYENIDFIIPRNFIALLKKIYQEFGDRKEINTLYDNGLIQMWNNTMTIEYKTNFSLPIEKLKIPYIVNAIDEVVVAKNGTMSIGFDSLDKQADYQLEPLQQPNTFDFDLKINSNTIKILDNLAMIADTNNPKRELNAVLFDVKNKEATLVATDTKRLQLTIEPININAKDGKYIIPKYLFTKEARSIKLDTNTNIVVLESNNIMKITKQIIGNYPEYRRIIPKNEGGIQFNVVAKDFLSFCDKAFRDKKVKKSKQILSMVFRGGDIFLYIEDDNELIATLNNAYKLGEDMEIHVKYQYIKEAIISKEASFMYVRKDMPFSITSGNVKTVIMPIIQ